MVLTFGRMESVRFVWATGSGFMLPWAVLLDVIVRLVRTCSEKITAVCVFFSRSVCSYLFKRFPQISESLGSPRVLVLPT